MISNNTVSGDRNAAAINVRRENLALARFQASKQQRQHGIDAIGELRIAPFIGMRRMMEANGGIEGNMT